MTENQIKQDVFSIEKRHDPNYNNINSILQESFKFDESEFEEHVLEVGHFDKIGPRKDVYGIVGKYSGIDKIEQKPIAGYLQLYTFDGCRDYAYSSPWSPTSHHPKRVADFCETQPFTVYLLKYNEDNNQEKQVMFLYDSPYDVV